jgi:23S rRNA (guanine745-N1)-methyltransferase
MNEAVVRFLICPVCGLDLRENGGSLVCSNGHTSNIARQGYVSLLGRYSGTHTADTAEMVAARERVLAAGHFDPVAEAIREEVAAPGVEETEGAIVDLGTGTGHYLAAALDAAPGRVGIGVDNSKYAARKAARSHERAGAIVADIWDEIPVRTEGAAIVINVFAPRNGREIERILSAGGRLVVVTPGPDHLRELIGPFGMVGVDPDKEQRLERSLAALAADLRERPVEWTMELDRGQVRDVVGMGPSAGRAEPAEFDAQIAALAETTRVTGSVRISTI